jgi:hypothetical protein
VPRLTPRELVEPGERNARLTGYPVQFQGTLLKASTSGLRRWMASSSYSVSMASKRLVSLCSMVLSLNNRYHSAFSSWGHCPS